MSGYLWEAYHRNDVHRFRDLLASATYSTRTGANKAGIGSPDAYSTSPTLSTKARKGTELPQPRLFVLTKSDLNSRDRYGFTLLHRAASSERRSAFEFAAALVAHPLTDLYVQDHESGWTALHRAFYAGKIRVAKLILDRDVRDNTSGLIKIKDHEGNGPLDLFALSIYQPSFSRGNFPGTHSNESPDSRVTPTVDLRGEDTYTWGSNRNVSLGLGNEDDRYHPELVNLGKSERAIRKFWKDFVEQEADFENAPYAMEVRASGGVKDDDPFDNIPTTIRLAPTMVLDVQMSKYATAVLTTDNVANLYVTGHGRGGRLGTGDERTKYTFVPVDALKSIKIVHVALGQDHTLALSETGDLYSWGSNKFGQLGYALKASETKRGEDPIVASPRRIFGPLKREVVRGIAASRIHSAVYTNDALFTFGKNDGQLGIMDSDARSLEIQPIPRRVGASRFTQGIVSVAAIDTATITLLDNHDVWVLTAYGYVQVTFSALSSFGNTLQSTLRTRSLFQPVKISAAGYTICALSAEGAVRSIAVKSRPEAESQNLGSTTNPNNIRRAIGQQQAVWTPLKSHMEATDIAVEADGALILATRAGTVWKRMKRVTSKDASLHYPDFKSRDYKFSLVSGLTRIVAVRTSGYGAHAAIRERLRVRDSSKQNSGQNTLWRDLIKICPLRSLVLPDHEDYDYSKWSRAVNSGARQLASLEAQTVSHFSTGLDEYNLEFVFVATRKSKAAIPVHRFLLSARSRKFRNAVTKLRHKKVFEMPDKITLRLNQGRMVLLLSDSHFLTLWNLVIFLYSDSFGEAPLETKDRSELVRYRLVRTELQRIAKALDMPSLDQAMSKSAQPDFTVNKDLAEGLKTGDAFFNDADTMIVLEDGEIPAHRAILCARCPFFQHLFEGQSGGQWVADREATSDGTRAITKVDLRDFRCTIFQRILRWIYTGHTSIDDAKTPDVDTLIDFILDIIHASDYLVLDELCEASQKQLGHHANLRNVCSLLVDVEEYSVKEFRDAALKYLCWNMEAIFHSRQLDSLTDTLLSALDSAALNLQLKSSGDASNRDGYQFNSRSLYLNDNDLKQFIDSRLASEVQAKRSLEIEDEIESHICAYKSRLAAESSSTAMTRSFSTGDSTQSPSHGRSRRKRIAGPPEQTSQDRPLGSLRSKNSAADLIFSMDDDAEEGEDSLDHLPTSKKRPVKHQPLVSTNRRTDQGVSTTSRDESLTPSTPQHHQSHASEFGFGEASDIADIQSTVGRSAGASAWGPSPLQVKKLDMKQIMDQTPVTGRMSNLTIGIAKSGSMPEHIRPSLPTFGSKMSQKERKKLQAKQTTASNTPSSPEHIKTEINPSSPWRTVSAQQKVSLRDITEAEASNTSTSSPQHDEQRTPSTPKLTMRQTLANSGPPAKIEAQKRSISEPAIKGASVSPAPQTTIQSVQHMKPTRAQEPELQLSMAEILSQQQAEKETIKQATLARDFKQIQDEQAWDIEWEKHKAAYQAHVASEERNREQAARAERAVSGRGRGGGRRGRRGGGSRGRGRGVST